MKLQISKNTNKILIKHAFAHTLVWGCLAIESGGEQRKTLLLQEGRGEERGERTWLLPGVEALWPLLSFSFSHTSINRCPVTPRWATAKGQKLEARILLPCDWTASSRLAPTGRRVQASLLFHVGVTLSGLETGLWWDIFRLECLSSQIFVNLLPHYNNLVYSSLGCTTKSINLQSKHFWVPGTGRHPKSKSKKLKEFKI